MGSPGPVGRVGVWARYGDVTPEQARELEELGFSALWLGGSPPAGLDDVDPLLAATEHLLVGTSIVNVWTAPAAQAARAYHRLATAYPGRFLLGIGAGHRAPGTGNRESNADYRTPRAALISYLDDLDALGVPREGRALAALGPRVLDLAAERTAGALPYLVTPEHTRLARDRLGPRALLVVEQRGRPRRAGQRHARRRPRPARSARRGGRWSPCPPRRGRGPGRGAGAVRRPADPAGRPRPGRPDLRPGSRGPGYLSAGMTIHKAM